MAASIRPRKGASGHRLSGCIALVAVPIVGLALPVTLAAKKYQKPAPASSRPLAPPPPRSALLTVEDWQKAPLNRLQPGEIDELVRQELDRDQIEPAPLTTDEQFIRRVTLDLTGALPLPADIDEFVADQDSAKRARLIDRLLDSEEYARHWSAYWSDVVTARLTDRRTTFLAGAFDEWLAEQFRQNAHWDRIARAIITAGGSIRFDDPQANGVAFFLAAHRGTDSASERAADTSRIFMGIQIQCAQCHDHPFDQWKRVQFHELAAFYARLGERPVRDGQRVVGFELVSLPRGEHEMSSKENPKNTFRTEPRFLDGKSPGLNCSDAARRRALADDIVSKDNYWFAAAFVNRLWGKLMGQAFYEPVDDMGPKREAVFPRLLTRLAAAFRASDYDIKGLLREILNSQTYQRQVRPLGVGEEHLHFAAAYPTRLPADALWASVCNALGPIPVGSARPERRRRGPPQGFDALFRQEFEFDPSAKADDVEGSIPQALLLMNSPVIAQRIQARGSNLLARILKAYPDDADALRILYLRTLARTPTEHELARCRNYLSEASSRSQGYEDILWSLLNSTEFETKR